LRTVLDPEVGVNLVDLGLIRRVVVEGDEARIDMVLTSPTCPMAGQLLEAVRRKVRSMPGIEKVQVTLLDEPWNWQWFVTRNGEGSAAADVLNLRSAENHLIPH